MKKHTNQSCQQLTGSFFTRNAEKLLQGFEDMAKGAQIVEPFAGDGDLVEWCLRHGAKSVEQYDLSPRSESVQQNDSIANPILDRPVVVTNPPWLARNRNKDKAHYEQWGQDDLYKCHLAALTTSKVERGILVLPANFLSEARGKARKTFFGTFRILRAKYYRIPVFADASAAVCVLVFERRSKDWWDRTDVMEFDVELITRDSSKVSKHQFHEQYEWLAGKEFFELIYSDPDPIKVTILRPGQKPNTSIVISLLTDGKLPMGAHLQEEPVFNDKSFTTYTVVTSVPVRNQQAVVDLYNKLLTKFVYQYDGLFLANYVEAHQKIKSRRYAALLLSHCIKQCS